MPIYQQMLDENEMNGYAKIDQYNPDSIRRIATHVHAMLGEIGEDPDREGLVKTPERVAKAMTRANGGTPLEYMLAVMRDERATPARRDKMALAAAPFVHQRMSPTIPDGDDQPAAGKKAAEARAAKNPDTSTTMGALLAKRGGRS